MIRECSRSARTHPVSRRRRRREFLGRSVVPAPNAPGADEISITELDLAPLQRWAPILVHTPKLLEQAINDVDLQWAQDGAAALADDGGGIEMTYGEIVQHHRSLSAIARRMRLARSVIRSSVSAARRSASEWHTPCPSWYSWAITASHRSRRRAFSQIDDIVGLGCGTRNGPAISSRFEAQSGAAEPWPWRGNAERWLGLVPSPPIEHSSLKVAKQEILEPRMKHG